jgi:CDP-diacylglycerol--glycerol-3-phosphate 3-phosphatidyltransferase
VVVIVGRELAVSGFRSIISAEGQVISASMLGKYKMISQSVTIVFLILAKLFFTNEMFRLIGQSLLWIVILLAIATAMDYGIKFWHMISPKLQRTKD